MPAHPGSGSTRPLRLCGSLSSPGASVVNVPSPTALIAGQSIYPVLVAESFRAKKLPIRLIAFEGETRDDLVGSFGESERVVLKVGQIGKMLKALEGFGAKSALMAGQITPRRLFQGLHPDMKALAILTRLKERNAETIFGAIAAEIEAIGVKLLDARTGLDEHLATHGVMTSGKSGYEEDALAHGIEIARTCAARDIGQGVVVRKGTVLAVEAFEGTDAMLRRAGTLSDRDMIFVKLGKPGQDTRFDVPVFGEQTLATMAEAKITTAALAAGQVLLLDKPTVLAEARRRGITIVGF